MVTSQSRTKPKSLYAKESEPNKNVSIEYEHQTMAPTFLTNKAYNVSYVSGKADQYGKQVGAERRNL
jgi:hypothetical protein